uniref:Uncharacterized protein n=1 Tax=Solanum lycopersicum TaxID=4081 RepID=A0A3Q7HTU2_SOLLC
MQSKHATEEAQHLKKLIQEYTASFIKIGDKGKKNYTKLPKINTELRCLLRVFLTSIGEDAPSILWQNNTLTMCSLKSTFPRFSFANEHKVEKKIINCICRILELTFFQLRKQRIHSSLANMSDTKHKMNALLNAQTSAAKKEAKNLRSRIAYQQMPPEKKTALLA